MVTFFLFRTNIDWCLPPCQLATRAIKEISEIYLEGDKQSNLPKHAVPILGDRAKYKRESKDMKRNRLEDAWLSYLLKKLDCAYFEVIWMLHIRLW